MFFAALIISLLCSSHAAQAAGTAVWLAGPPDPRVVADSAAITAAVAAPAPTPATNYAAASAQLAAEVVAVPPLLDVFNGELQVLRRLDLVVDDLPMIQREDRAVIVQARSLQGLAAWRYFQDDLQTDPAAGPFRTLLDPTDPATQSNRAWVNAIAMDPESSPSAELMPEERARLAYQQLKARLLLLPDATVTARDLPKGASLVVDGRPASSGRARLMAGQHWLQIDGPDGSLVTQRIQLISGQELFIDTPASAAELIELGNNLRPGTPSPLPSRVVTRLALLPQPVTLVVQRGREIHAYRVDQGTALPVPASALPQTTAGAATDGRMAADGLALSLHAGVSQGWVSDGQWYLLHAADGAPATRATVNAAAPGLNVAAAVRRGLLAASLGVDLRLPLGDFHTLTVDQSQQRLRLHPYLGLGLPWVQATVGADLPWRLGLGARLCVPITGPVELTGGALWGLGLSPARGDNPSDNQPDFVPGDSITAWLGVGVTFGSGQD